MALAQSSSIPSGPYHCIHKCPHSQPVTLGVAEAQQSKLASHSLDQLEKLGLEGYPNDSLDGMTSSFTGRGASDNPDPALSNPLDSEIEMAQLQTAIDIGSNTTTTGPFHRWMRTLRRRVSQRLGTTHNDDEDSVPRHLQSPPPRRHTTSSHRYKHEKSYSDSSFGLVYAVRSSSASLASGSVKTWSQRRNKRSWALSRTDCSSMASMSLHRASEDSAVTEKPIALNPDAVQRSIQRRRILEELIDTEESYIGDIRFLMNVYVTILASLPSLSTSLRSSINRNVSDIVELHESILGDLHLIIPHSEYKQIDIRSASRIRFGMDCQRGWGLDAVPENNDDMTWLHHVPGMVSDPQAAAEVAKVFSKQLSRFFVYREYGATYEMMIRDISSIYDTMPSWEMYQKGLENLASTLGSARSNESVSKRSLTIGDLLMKPVQRICKYPLLLAELLKCTPVLDCPNSHMEIEDALLRTREATAEINRATSDDLIKATLERTWLIQDRLIFPNRKLDATSRSHIRSFGHIKLCGALHVCWQSQDRVEGQYMACLLYPDILCLASAGRVDPIYSIRACIDLDSVSVEEVDNGRGLQCHTAMHSWKVVFEIDHELYEMLMTACNSREEDEWRRRLGRRTARAMHTKDPNAFCTLLLNMKSFGTVFSRPGTVARTIAIQRATTVGSKSPLAHVVLKNTSASRVNTNSPLAATRIHRSQSLLTTNPIIHILAPARSDRARLEALLGDVWTREVLSFPGMVRSRSRSEHIVRSSASTVMRKLSVASITGSFRKRNGSFGRNTRSDDEAQRSEACPRLERISSPRSTASSKVRPDVEKAGRIGEPAVQDGSEDGASFSNADTLDQEPTNEWLGIVQRRKVSGSSSFASGSNTLVEQTKTVLQSPSTTGANLTLSGSCETIQVLSVEKENDVHRWNFKARGPGQWAKTRSVKGETKGHGFRSFFR